MEMPQQHGQAIGFQGRRLGAAAMPEQIHQNHLTVPELKKFPGAGVFRKTMQTDQSRPGTLYLYIIPAALNRHEHLVLLTYPLIKIRQPIMELFAQPGIDFDIQHLDPT